MSQLTIYSIETVVSCTSFCRVIHPLVKWNRSHFTPFESIQLVVQLGCECGEPLESGGPCTLAIHGHIVNITVCMPNTHSIVCSPGNW